MKKVDALSTQATIKTPEDVVSERGPILVISGSCATITGEQILWSKDNGFYDIPINPQNLLNSTRRYPDREQIVSLAINLLAEGKSVILHTAIGPNDERIAAMHRAIEELSLAKSEANNILGSELGGIAHEIISGSFLKRIVISGGDTAGRILKILQVEALQISKSIGIAAPLCYVYSKLPKINGLEMAFKGGQIGKTDYFNQAKCQPTLNFKAAALGYI